MTRDRKNFPAWDTLYDEMPVEKMAWYNPVLDTDLNDALTEYNINEGNFLDIGTGPGTQAIELAKLGFNSYGSDISKKTVTKAKKLAKKFSVSVNYMCDDMFNSTINKKFDYIFDRGCFHTIKPTLRKKYINTLKSLIKTDGYIFLKTFSLKETWDDGPYRFTPEDIQNLFSSSFKILSSRETVYQGNIKPSPKALFSILRKK